MLVKTYKKDNLVVNFKVENKGTEIDIFLKVKDNFFNFDREFKETLIFETLEKADEFYLEIKKTLFKDDFTDLNSALVDYFEFTNSLENRSKNIGLDIFNDSNLELIRFDVYLDLKHYRPYETILNQIYLILEIKGKPYIFKSIVNQNLLNIVENMTKEDFERLL
ncbi:hypothetical protein [Vagococcus fluvialis]|uniref:hypothetical protein n=1 Tax=Vagococcus fluvialis TaxID=2738 RepID=UPI001D0B74B3|nr:hypothetical protein [Vagococcus fluvialis]UDM84095.1 hypothetical protein K5K96_15230 [Vagococcus fluvialis]